MDETEPHQLLEVATSSTVFRYEHAVRETKLVSRNHLQHLLLVVHTIRGLIPKSQTLLVDEDVALT
eukprot:40581-Eustigmatos_ZCMA.PRE.1